MGAFFFWQIGLLTKPLEAAPGVYLSCQIFNRDVDILSPAPSRDVGGAAKQNSSALESLPPEAAWVPSGGARVASCYAIAIRPGPAHRTNDLLLFHAGWHFVHAKRNVCFIIYIHSRGPGFQSVTQTRSSVKGEWIPFLPWCVIVFIYTTPCQILLKHWLID